MQSRRSISLEQVYYSRQDVLLQVVIYIGLIQRILCFCKDAFDLYSRLIGFFFVPFHVQLETCFSILFNIIISINRIVL